MSVDVVSAGDVFEGRDLRGPGWPEHSGHETGKGKTDGKTAPLRPPTVWPKHK